MKRILAITAAVASLMMAACSKDDSASSKPTYALHATVTDSAAYQPEAFAAALLQSPQVIDSTLMTQRLATTMSILIDRTVNTRHYYLDTVFARKSGRQQEAGDREWQIETYSFTYQSLASDGKAATLSGRVTFPAYIDGRSHEVKSLSIIAHPLLLGTDKEPSRTLSAYDVRVLYNSAVIEPDFQGFGASESMSYCGFMYDVEGQQLYDCTRAALQVMEEHGVTLAPDGYSTGWGYSLGAPAIVAFARLYDERLTDDEREKISLRSISAGGGPMLLHRVIELIDQDPSYNAMLIQYFFPLMRTLPADAFEGYSLKDFMPEWMQWCVADYNGMQYTYYEALMQDLPDAYALRPEVYDATLVKNHFASDMCTADGHLDFDNRKTQILMRIFRSLSDWGSWMPSMQIYITHNTSDNCMPLQQSKEFCKLKEASGKVHFKTESMPLIMYALFSNGHGYATANSFITTILYEDPATAFEHTH